jgi:pimeloyl-ACP methyl ester carboxylesterase
VVELLEHLQIPRAIWVGHSMGARTAAAGAFLRPDRVQALVLVDLGFAGPAGGGLGDTLATFLKQIPEGYPNRSEARTRLLEDCPDVSIGRYLLAVLQPQADGTLRFPFDREALLSTIEAARETEFRSKVRALAEQGIPAWALRGENSTVWSREDFERERKGFTDLPGVHFMEFAGTGHGLPFEKRAEFVELLTRIHEASSRL